MSEKAASTSERTGRERKVPGRSAAVSMPQPLLALPAGQFAERIGNRALSALLGNPAMRGPASLPGSMLAPPARPASMPGHIKQALRSPAQRIGNGVDGERSVEALAHHGSAAAGSARLLGARAYQVGPHVVFGSGQWQPLTASGRQLIAHELTHVRQTRGQMPTQFRIDGPDHPSEIQADRLAMVPGAALPTAQAPALHLARDPRLSRALDGIRDLVGPLTTRGAAQGIDQALAGIDLTDADNLEPVIATIGEHFDARQRGEILSLFLRALDQMQPAQPVPSAPSVPSAEQEARMERQFDMMRIQPRGPYRQVGPGVLGPVLAQPARHLVPLMEAIGNGLAGSGGFASGLLAGLSASMSEAEREQLATQLLQSSVLNAVFPAVFASGAVVGIAEDVVDAVKGLYHTFTNFREVIDGFLDLVRTLLSRESAAVARLLGEQIGRDFGQRVAQLARGNIIEFTFGLGRMIGPTMVYTVLGFLGVPEMLAAAVIGRILGILRPLLQRFPRLLALMQRMAGRMVRAGTHRASANTRMDPVARRLGHLSDEERALHRDLDDVFGRIEAGDVPAGQGAMVGDLLHHADRAAAVQTISRQRQASGLPNLPTRPGRSPPGVAVNPNPGWQSAHTTPQSGLRDLANYDPGEMVTRLLPTGRGHAHTVFDQAWQREFRQIRATTGQSQITAREFAQVIERAARNSGAFSAAEAETVAAMIIDDLYFRLNLQPTSMVRIPGSRQE